MLLVFLIPAYFMELAELWYEVRHVSLQNLFPFLPTILLPHSMQCLSAPHSMQSFSSPLSSGAAAVFNMCLYRFISCRYSLYLCISVCQYLVFIVNILSMPSLFCLCCLMSCLYRVCPYRIGRILITVNVCFKVMVLSVFSDLFCIFYGFSSDFADSLILRDSVFP